MKDGIDFRCVHGDPLGRDKMTQVSYGLFRELALGLLGEEAMVREAEKLGEGEEDAEEETGYKLKCCQRKSRCISEARAAKLSS